MNIDVLREAVRALVFHTLPVLDEASRAAWGERRRVAIEALGFELPGPLKPMGRTYWAEAIRSIECITQPVTASVDSLRERFGAAEETARTAYFEAHIDLLCAIVDRERA